MKRVTLTLVTPLGSTALVTYNRALAAPERAKLYEWLRRQNLAPQNGNGLSGAPKRAKKLKPSAKQKPFQLSTAMRRILRRLDSIRSWTSPTEIGLSLNERHSAWASPKCLVLTKQGYLQRSPWGHYRRTKKRIPA